MSCNACSTTTSAIVALAASGCLVVCGTIAALAAGESSTKTDEGWSTEVRTGDARVTTAAIEANAKKVDAPSKKKVSAPTEKKIDNKAAEPAAAKRKDTSGKKDLFQPDPQYEKKYSVEEQVDIYGAKSAVEPPRPLVELGRPQYTSGIYDESSTFLGEKNLLLPGLAIYGDWRTAVAYNNNNGKDIAQIATRLNIDVDLKISGTERIHAFFTPLQENNNKFTRFEFGGGDGNEDFNDEFDFEPQTLFFEGDVGSLYSGFSGQEASFDLPFTVGLFPLFLQNGIWANDAILGGAVSLPAKNSAALGLANFDVTFFAAFDNVDNAGIIGAGDDDNHLANLYGVTAFIDAFDGYIEAGYGLIQGRDEQDGLLTHFLTASYSRRYLNTLSNSTRLFANFGDDPVGDSNGIAIISENSLISGLPSTLLPYANFFVGFGNPQPLVDGNGAGILKNVGINFETDALTGYPKLDDTGSNALGGALGLQYLFNLDEQLVFEVAMVQPFENDGIGAEDPQYGFGVRYQIPIDRAWLFRADATYQILEGGDEDNFGVRAEVRRKF
ncbi:hypothetical protein GIW81_10405 [Hyphomicrobium sp. xq]|uniref:Porin n=1 Tax=Hyphomicrobium album TaxID=2665159 RepID=A0A6I3KLV4_9HYPH|nr:hypothetical protein [Hyphomicrobium album]MTD94742.1 hypothetical protein [Hyphomicrobium album]